MKARRVRTPSHNAVMLVGVAAVVVLALLVFWLNRRVYAERAVISHVSDMILAIAFAVVGLLIVVQRPRHRVGHIFCIVGFGILISDLCELYAVYSSIARGGLPGGVAAAWISAWLWVFPFVTMFTFLLLLFPEGELPSPRWRPVGWASGGLFAMAIVAAAFRPTLKVGEGMREVQIPNPLGIPGAGPISAGLDKVAEYSFPFVMLLCGISLIFRFRRSRGSERQQLKWFATAGVVTVVVFAVASTLEQGVLQDVLIATAVVTIPLSAGTAILRYRLYEIDVVINRTLVYGGLTTFLAAAYASLVVVLQSVLGTFDSGNNLAVAASTLAVAGLFTPARRAIQGFIDRRFYRSKYDAERTLQEFSTRLREEVDLESLSRELVGVVQTTMQPNAVSLWIARQPNTP